MTDIRSGAGAAAPLAQAEIAGFWRRIFALWLDALVLGAVGFAILHVDFDRVVALGSEGRLIGFAIALVYFGVLNSRYGGSASIGKRILGLRVVGRSGKGIGLLRALLRTLVLTAPFFLNGVFFAVTDTRLSFDNIWLILGALDVVIVFAGGFAILYLYIFNRRTRQSLHDLVVGSFVVRAESARAPVTAHVWRGHLVVVSLLLIGLVAAIPLTLAWFGNSGMMESFSGMTALMGKVDSDPRVLTSQVQESTFYMTGAAPTTSLVVAVQLKRRVSDLEPEADWVASIVLATAPDLLGRQFLNVSVSYSADVGIWRERYAYNVSHTRADWLKRLHRGGSKEI